MVTLVFGPEFGRPSKLRLVSYCASLGPCIFAAQCHRKRFKRDRGGELSLHSPANVTTKREGVESRDNKQKPTGLARGFHAVARRSQA